MSIDEIADAAVSAAQAGAAMIHLHAREAGGEPTQRLERYEALVDAVRSRGCEAILNLSTGSAGGRTFGAERYSCLDLRPEVASFDCGSLNFNDRVFENSPAFLRDMAQAFQRSGAKPEIECFDAGHIGIALRLRDEGLLSDPMHFQLVLGVNGGGAGTIEQMLYMRSLLPQEATWSICATGRHQLPLNVLGLISGGHLRTGLEDNIYYSRGVLAESNGQLVERLVRIAREFGRRVATPDEARGILGLSGEL